MQCHRQLISNRITHRMICKSLHKFAIFFALHFFAAGFGTQALADLPPLKWSIGDHSLDLSLTSRVRYETWDARTTTTDGFWGYRTNIGAKYSYGKHVSVYAEFQDTRVYGVSPDNTFGPGFLYMGTSKHDNFVVSDRLRNLWIEVKPVESVALRAGRQDILFGAQVKYAEGNWNYLRLQRLAQRLVGSVGWSNGQRAYDGLTVNWDHKDHNVYGFYARPTTGVFDIENAYKQFDDIDVGGIGWTIKRGVYLPNTELGLFGIDYHDDRDPSDGGLKDGDIDILTFGAQMIGVYPVGPGNLDLTLWVAYQTGDYGKLDHRAYAGIAEAGYQFTKAPWKPWIRIGVNAASGDGDAKDGDHETFHNLLPTNHPYMGFADQFAFQNLVDYFVQLRLQPIDAINVDLYFHQFASARKNDSAYYGTGAFRRTPTGGLGYGAYPSAVGHHSLGSEIDLVISGKINKHVQLEGGYSYMWGHAAFNNMADDDTRFGYVQATFTY